MLPVQFGIKPLPNSYRLKILFPEPLILLLILGQQLSRKTTTDKPVGIFPEMHFNHLFQIIISPDEHHKAATSAPDNGP